MLGSVVLSSYRQGSLGHFPAEARIKKIHPLKIAYISFKNNVFLIFWETERSGLKIEKVLIFSEKKRKKNIFKKFLYIRREFSELEKNFKRPNLKKFLTFWEIELSRPKLKNSWYFKRELPS